MNYILPEISQGIRLNFNWFPTHAQCFIYRNWGLVEPERLASVLGVTCDVVNDMAADMGLSLDVYVSPEWLTRGYITLIRNNWHLIDYNQLCILLGWSAEHLAFILKEDDFLDVKLGGFKPDTGTVKVESLSPEQKRRTAEICALTKELTSRIQETKTQPFEFFADVFVDSSNEQIQNPRFGNRIVYSYCALYGDTFIDKQLLDLTFPDELLSAYEKLGVNGIWTQALLSKMTMFPYDKELSERYETRLEGLNYLIKKLKKYNLKLFLYLNEPRSMPESFFEKYPELRGDSNERGECCICVSHPSVQKYLRDATAFLVKAAPELGGFFTITASENKTNCYSHKNESNISCSLCKEKSRAEVFALVNKLVAEGAASVNPDFEVIAWNWGWDKPGSTETSTAVIDHLTQNVSIMSVSEHDVSKIIYGTETRVIDYSISVEGPGEYSKAVWKYARENGNRAYAKIQSNITWEIASVPFIPVFDKIYRHIKGISEANDPNGLMLGWTLGGYPSVNMALIKEFYDKSKELPDLNSIYKKLFPGNDIKTLAKAFTMLSDAFDEFPFSLFVAYNAPQQCAPANLLYEKSTGLSATMVCFPHDNLDGWRGFFPNETYLRCLKNLCEKWQAGFEMLDNTDCTSGYLPLIYISAKTCLLHFKSMYNQALFVLAREKGEDCTEIIKQEAQIAEEIACIVASNPTIGYESSNHYFYTKSNLLEKIINCDYLIKRKDNILQ